ncbi:hypothetical protein MMC29_002345 [Sticta canariensis]|nr:hypothetical protein [Sticta canariensis]
MLQSSEQKANHERVQNLCIFNLASFVDENDNTAPLGVLSKDRLVFLDQDYWMCTWHISEDSTILAPKKCFFLPKDWINAEAPSICVFTASGTFLYPRNGEIALIESGLGGPEMVQC